LRVCSSPIADEKGPNRDPVGIPGKSALEAIFCYFFKSFSSSPLVLSRCRRRCRRAISLRFTGCQSASVLTAASLPCARAPPNSTCYRRVDARSPFASLLRPWGAGWGPKTLNPGTWEAGGKTEGCDDVRHPAREQGEGADGCM